MVMGPAALNLLQSCKREPEFDWEPVFLTPSNGFALKQLLDVIIPATDTPGANDLNIAMFIDSYFREIAEENHQEEFTRSADAFAAVFRNEYAKNQEEGTPEEYEDLVKKFLKATPKERERFARRETETQDPMDTDPAEVVDFEAGAFSYLKNVREMVIWAWKNSEEIGENVLWYDQIPAEYIPCGPVGELGGGKAMSL